MSGKRRAHGEGTIYKRKTDGRWVASISLVGGRRKSLYAKTQTEVRAKLTAALRDRDRGLPIGQNERATLGEYLASWLPKYKEHVRFDTYRRAEESVRLHIVPTLGKIPLARLHQSQLESFYAQQRAEGLAISSVQRLHAVLSAALGDAERLDLVQRNAARLAQKPSMRGVVSKMRALTPDEAGALLAAAEGDRLEALYVLAVTTGMRRGELLALHWRDVSLDAGKLQVRYTLQERKGGVFEFAEPKSASGRRQVSLTQHAVRALRAHHTRQLAERLRAGSAWTAAPDRDLVFCNELGEPLHGGRVLDGKFRPLLARAGLPRTIRFHDLRHTAATLLLRQGQSGRIVQVMLGHSNVSMTLGTYSHVTPDMQESAAASLDALLDGLLQKRR